MATSTLDLDDLKRHIGRRQVTTDVATAGPANLLRLALGRPEPELAIGAPVPAGWQILYFLPSFGPGELRPDGSPRDAGVVPAMPLPRRMFAGERMTFHHPIRIGDPLRRETELIDIALKAGGTGTLVFATVRNRIFAADTLAMEEERRTVFREEVKSGEKNQAPGGRRPPPTSRGGGGSRRMPCCSSASRPSPTMPPHPLRPPVRDRGRGIPRARRARAAHRAAHRLRP